MSQLLRFAAGLMIRLSPKGSSEAAREAQNALHETRRKGSSLLDRLEL